MATMIGTVEWMGSKDVNTKWGLKPKYSMKINGQWFSAGFKKALAMPTGTQVEVEYVTGAYGNDVTSIKATTGGVAPTAGTTASEGAATPSKSYGRDRPFPIPVTHGDRSIIRQNALTHATNLYTTVVVDGSKKLDLKKAAEEIVELAYIFEEYSSGSREQKMAEEAVAKMGKVGTITSA